MWFSVTTGTGTQAAGFRSCALSHRCTTAYSGAPVAPGITSGGGGKRLECNSRKIKVVYFGGKRPIDPILTWREKTEKL